MRGVSNRLSSLLIVGILSTLCVAELPGMIASAHDMGDDLSAKTADWQEQQASTIACNIRIQKALLAEDDAQLAAAEADGCGR